MDAARPDAGGAQALFETVITAMLSFVVITFGSLLVAVQIASGQLTPRIIATTLLRDGIVKYVVGLFSFTLFFAVSALNQMGKDVHQLAVFVTACLGIACFAAFFYLIDYAARLLRPVSILARVGDAGIAVIDSVYPDASIVAPPNEPEDQSLGVPDRIVIHERTSGIILAVNVRLLVAAAAQARGVIALAPQVAKNDPLFKLHDGAALIDSRALTESVVFGSERTLDQDPTFAFRIVVEIALTGTLIVCADIPNPAKLLIDGQLIKVELQTGEPQERVLVPQAALIADQQGIYIFVTLPRQSRSIAFRIASEGKPPT
jgi:uncharacterized membrane protein